MNKFSISLAQWAITLLLPIVLSLSTLYIIATDAYVRYEYGKPDFPASIKFTPDARYYN